MKKLTLFLLLLLLLAPISACKQTPPDPAPPATDSPATDTPPSPPDTPPPVTPDTPTDPPSPPTPFVLPFQFTRDNFPKLDGSTSMVPLGEAIACVLLGQPREQVSYLISFSKTTEAYRNLAAGYSNVSIVIASEPDWELVNRYEERDVRDTLELAAIAVDSLVFIVNASNPINNLTTAQVQKIYTGEYTNWKQVGGDDVPIAAFQRNADSGSQSLMQKLVMPGLKLAVAPSEYAPGEMGGLITAVKSFDASASAIGYTVYYYANDMRMAEGLKILSIDGVAPNDKTLASGEYPFTNPYYAAIRRDAAPKSPERYLFDWLQSDEGRALIRSEGYVPAEG